MAQAASFTFSIADTRYNKKLRVNTNLNIGCAQSNISFRWFEGVLLVYPKKGPLLIGNHHILYTHRVHAGDRLYLNGIPIDVIEIQPLLQKDCKRKNIFDDMVTLYGAFITTIGHMLV